MSPIPNAPNLRTRVIKKKKGGAFFTGIHGFGGGRRSEAALPHQRGEEAQRREIQSGGFRARGGRSREEEETDEKSGSPSLYIAQGVRAAVVPLTWR